MNETLKNKLLNELNLTEAHVTALEAEGVVEEKHLKLLTAQEIKDTLNCGLVLAKEVFNAFNPQPTPVPVVAPIPVAPSSQPQPTPVVNNPGAPPTQAEVTAFAGNVGMDANFLNMFLFANMAGGAGMDVDFSGMIPYAQVVPGYSPKKRDIAYMIMGQLEKRLGTPIVLINSDGSVNHAKTIEYITSLEEGFEPAGESYTDSDNNSYEIIKVGIDAQSIYDADPLVPTSALQKTGIGHGRVNWSKVGETNRQIIYFAVKMHELDPNDNAALTWLRTNINSVNKMQLQAQYPLAVVEYNKAARSGSLPNLKVMLSRGPRAKEIMTRRRTYESKELTPGLTRTKQDLD